MLASGNGNSDDIREAMELIDQQAQRAGEVVRGIRSFVTKREGRRTLVDVNDLVRGAVKLAQVEERGREARIECRLAEGALPAAVDVIPMQQVILNLVRNGMEVMESTNGERGAVIVETASGGDEVLVRVIDRGAGLSADAEQNLFKPFFTTKEDGMGMGLCISKSILASHGGRLWFTRNADRGLTFHVSLPKASARDVQQSRS
jgi:C4-dicarboxylate-specific signal transduction histidine kinase